MPLTLEQQLDALIAEHRLSSINLTRIVSADGTSFWAIYAQADGVSATNVEPWVSAEAALTDAIERLNAKRAFPVIVPGALATLDMAEAA